MELLYSDAHIVVCVKPVGLDSERQVPEALEKQLSGRIYPLHRLDQNVGGVMVYARTAAAAAELSEQIRQGEMTKEYVALVHGTPAHDGTWQDLLFKDSRRNKVFVVDRERRGVKAASLRYQCLRSGEVSLVQVLLHTGRSHQIRAQFSSRGFPLVGDHKYGSRAKQTAPMLFSCRVRFTLRGQEMQFQALPEWASEAVLTDLLETLKK